MLRNNQSRSPLPPALRRDLIFLTALFAVIGLVSPDGFRAVGSVWSGSSGASVASEVRVTTVRDRSWSLNLSRPRLASTATTGAVPQD